MSSTGEREREMEGLQLACETQVNSRGTGREGEWLGKLKMDSVDEQFEDRAWCLFVFVKALARTGQGSLSVDGEARLETAG